MLFNSDYFILDIVFKPFNNGFSIYYIIGNIESNYIFFSDIYFNLITDFYYSKLSFLFSLTELIRHIVDNSSSIFIELLESENNIQVCYLIYNLCHSPNWILKPFLNLLIYFLHFIGVSNLHNDHFKYIKDEVFNIFYVYIELGGYLEFQFFIYMYKKLCILMNKHHNIVKRKLYHEKLFCSLLEFCFSVYLFNGFSTTNKHFRLILYFFYRGFCIIYHKEIISYIFSLLANKNLLLLLFKYSLRIIISRCFINILIHLSDIYNALLACYLNIKYKCIFTKKYPYKCFVENVNPSVVNSTQLLLHDNIETTNPGNLVDLDFNQEEYDDINNTDNSLDEEGNINLSPGTMPECLNILGLNVCGIASKLRNGAFEHYVQNYDILCFTETKTNSPDISNTSLNNFKCIPLMPKVRAHRYGGAHGICVLIRDKFANYFKVIDNLSSLSTLWLSFSGNAFSLPFILGVTYLPGEGSTHYDEDMFDNLLEDLVTLKEQYDTPICIVGDFNSRTGNLDDFVTIEDHVLRTINLDNIEEDIFSSKNDLESKCFEINRFNKDNICNNNGKQLIEVCRAADIKMVNGRFGNDHKIGNNTCHKPNGSSAIDYFIVSPIIFDYIKNFTSDQMDTLLSDVHSPIILSLDILKKSTINSQNALVVDNTHVLPVDIPYKPIQTKWLPEKSTEYLNCYDLECMNKLFSDLQEVIENNYIGLTQVLLDDKISSLEHILLDPSVRCGFSKTRVSNNTINSRKNNSNKPWFDVNCKNKRNEYFRIKNILKKSKTNTDRLKIESKKYKNFIRNSSRKFFKKFHSDIRNLKSKDPKQYWNLMSNKNKNQKSNNIPIMTLLDHFKSLGTEGDKDNHFDPRNCDIPENDQINQPFTKKEVLDVINKLKNNKACGVDNIINEFIKCCPVAIYDILVMIFNIILNTGIVPTIWSISLIQPIYKGKGSVNEPDNFRGISLISCLSKIFTAVINNRLSFYLNDSDILGEEQAGFREHYCTSDHIFVLNTLINIYQTKNKQIYCAFVDYRKAFDFINRSNLWGKLLEQGINGKIITVIYNLYENSKSCVKKGNTISPSFSSEVGVRQGDNLSPLLFALYLNDFKLFLSMRFNGLKMSENLVHELLSSDEIVVFIQMYVLLYADDTIILAESPKELQKALDALYDYCKVWDLKVNTTKTNIVIFSRGKKLVFPIFKFGDETINVVENYTYLGTIINYNGKYSKAIHKQVTQANRASFSLRSKQAKFKLPLDILFNLFDTLIIPILLYGSEIWGYEKLSEIEVFYKKIIKYSLKLNL